MSGHANAQAQAASKPAVTPAPSGVLRRQCACGNHAAGGECAGCKKKREGVLQRAAAGAGPQVAPPIVHDVLRSPGQPLDAATRAFMEPRFGRDFSAMPVHSMAPSSLSAALVVGSPEDVHEQEAERVAGRVMALSPAGAAGSAGGFDLGGVRIHTDATAAESARALGARAYTVGSDIVFAPGQYAPHNAEGQRLIAHELTHMVQQSRIGRLAQRQPAPDAQTVDPGTRAGANDALNAWERAGNRALSRYRNWLTHNMILFLSDVLQSGQGSAAIQKVTGSFAQNVAEQALGNLGALAGVELGARAGGRTLARLFLSLRTARVFGGFIGFVVGAIIEALIGTLLDRTNEIIRTTADQIDRLVTQFVNPVVNDQQDEVTRAIQDLRTDMAGTQLSIQEWRQITTEINTAIAQVDQVFRDENDETLYRQLALSADVYSRSLVPAEATRPVGLSGPGAAFHFAMQQANVKTGMTSIVVPRDNGTITISSQAYDCLSDEDDAESFHPVDIRGPDAAPSWQLTPPPREYHIRLYKSGWLSDTTVGVRRTFRVGSREYGIWYNVPSGTYHMSIERSSYHPVALCAEGQYWVGSGPR